jgi:hypothetical protein
MNDNGEIQRPARPSLGCVGEVVTSSLVRLGCYLITLNLSSNGRPAGSDEAGTAVRASADASRSDRTESVARAVGDDNRLA